MNRSTRIFGGVLASGGLGFLVLGCDLLPQALRPPGAQTAAQSVPSIEDPEIGDLTIFTTLTSDEGDRGVQFNGPDANPLNDTTMNDIAHLVVGIFDFGSTTVPSFGYLYAAEKGVTNPAASVVKAGTAGQEWIFKTTVGVLGDASGFGKIGRVTCVAVEGCAVTDAMRAQTRRLLVRDYLTGKNWSSATTATQFRNIPLVTSSNQHKYIVFAAAYDGNGSSGSLPNLLGYAEAAIKDASHAYLPTSNANLSDAGSSFRLTLKLNESILESPNAFSEVPTLTTFIPQATD